MSVLEKSTSSNVFIAQDLEKQSDGCENASRRQFLTGTVSASLVIGSGLITSSLSAPVDASEPPIGPQSQVDRQLAARQLRADAADLYLTRTLPPQSRNDDEVIYNDRRAVFAKTTKHHPVQYEPLSVGYRSLLDALESGDPDDFDKIKLAPNAQRKLANPQAAYAYDLTGGDTHESRIREAPPFASAEQAAEMGEVYWHAITRDVPYIEFETNSLIADACTDLNNFSETVGPKDGGIITPLTIFRGTLSGPHISQFLLQDIPYGPSKIVQRYGVPLAGQDYLEDIPSWLAIQEGEFPASGLNFDPVPRYIYNQRALGEYVHTDVVAQAYLNAALIILGYGPDALASSNPYKGSDVEGGFITFGVANILDLITRASSIALKTAWYQKWLVHRRLRPEVFGLRVEQQRNGSESYGIHPELMASDAVAVAAANNANGLALLGQAYPEGSPTHPAYPAGHATIAGACCLILKAFFNDDFVIPNPVEASFDGTTLLPYSLETLTLGKEIDKLAANITLGRDSAGVHYRSDGEEGIIAGEQVALGLLQDASITYNEIFDGFNVTRFDGSSYLIKDGIVTPV